MDAKLASATRALLSRLLTITSQDETKSAFDLIQNELEQFASALSQSGLVDRLKFPEIGASCVIREIDQQILDQILQLPESALPEQDSAEDLVKFANLVALHIIYVVPAPPGDPTDGPDIGGKKEPRKHRMKRLRADFVSPGWQGTDIDSDEEVLGNDASSLPAWSSQDGQRLQDQIVEEFHSGKVSKSVVWALELVSIDEAPWELHDEYPPDELPALQDIVERWDEYEGYEGRNGPVTLTEFSDAVELWVAWEIESNHHAYQLAILEHSDGRQVYLKVEAYGNSFEGVHYQAALLDPGDDEIINRDTKPTLGFGASGEEIISLLSRGAWPLR